MKTTKKISLFTIFLFSLTITDALAETEISVSIGNGLKTYRKIMSWREIRDKDVVKQKYDYSCGSGALATLMNISFGESVNEDDIIEFILRDKSPIEIEDIGKKGYSLLELKKVAENMGYITALYKLQMHHLRQLKGPVLIYFEPDGEKHFAVLKEVKGDRVYLADPARGNIRLSINRFQEEWTGIVLAIDKVRKLGRDEKRGGIYFIDVTFCEIMWCTYETLKRVQGDTFWPV